MKKNYTIMKIRTYLFFTLWMLFGFNVLAQGNSENHPLEQFNKFIGGEWHMDGSYQVFQWGVGKKSIIAQSYFIINGESTLVSEGSWFWHPGEKKIRGYFTAVQMPVELFDYTVSFEGNTMVCELRSFDPSGTISEYIETWEFTDVDHYNWTLYSPSPEGKKKVMGGIYERKNN